MTPPRPAFVLVLLLALLALLGNAACNRPRVERLEEHQAQRTEQHQAASSSAELERTHATVTHQRVTRRTTTTTTAPDGAVTSSSTDELEETDTGEEEHEAAAAHTKTSASSASSSSTDTVRESAPAPADAPRLRLALLGEWTSTRLELKPELRAEAELRVLGPLWLRATVVPPVLNQRLELRGAVVLAGEW